jgi:hypothetical protein
MRRAVVISEAEAEALHVLSERLIDCDPDGWSRIYPIVDRWRLAEPPPAVLIALGETFGEAAVEWFVLQCAAALVERQRGRLDLFAQGRVRALSEDEMSAIVKFALGASKPAVES